jgi:hypothetical protein
MPALTHLRLPARGLLLALVLQLVSLPVCSGQSDDFNDGNDTGWTRYNPLTGVGLPGGTFTVSNGTYIIDAAANASIPQAGAGRLGALRLTPAYTDFCVSFDLLPGWETRPDTAFGVLARVPASSIGLGTTDGYAFTYQNADNDVQISLVNDEAASEKSPPIPLVSPLDPARTYRFVFWGRGARLEARIYDLADLTTPLVTATTDAATEHASGICGLVAFDNGGNQGARLVVDNYDASALLAPPLHISLAGAADVTVEWEAARSLAHQLQFSPTLAAETWQSIESGGFATVGRRLLIVQEGVTGSGYFRLTPILPAP